MASMTSHHPTAIIEKGAQIDENVSIGAYAYIGANVKIAKGCIIHHHASVEGYTIMGEANEVFPYALIGGKTHDLKFKGGKPGLIIADHNVFREYTSIHPATDDGDFTRVGSNNTILAYSHIAHDCIVGNNLVMSSHSALGGHAVVGDHVNIGWGVGVHQFCSIGTYSMISACSKVVQDIPPFMLADGSPADVRTINKIGLERSGFSAKELELARKVFKIIYKEGHNKSQALEKLENHEFASDRIIKEVISFAQSSSRGLA
jgi:UDP-N-acetylglucosamine acyltransferase